MLAISLSTPHILVATTPMGVYACQACDQGKHRAAC